MAVPPTLLTPSSGLIPVSSPSALTPSPVPTPPNMANLPRMPLPNLNPLPALADMVEDAQNAVQDAAQNAVQDSAKSVLEMLGGWANTSGLNVLFMFLGVVYALMGLAAIVAVAALQEVK